MVTSDFSSRAVTWFHRSGYVWLRGLVAAVTLIAATPAIVLASSGQLYNQLDVRARSPNTQILLPPVQFQGSHTVPVVQDRNFRISASAGNFEGHAQSVHVFPPHLSGVSASLVAGTTEVNVELQVSMTAAPGERTVQILYPVGDPGYFKIEVLPTPRILHYQPTSNEFGAIKLGTGIYSGGAHFEFASCQAGQFRATGVLSGQNLDISDLQVDCVHCSEVGLNWQGSPASSTAWNASLDGNQNVLGKSVRWRFRNARDIYGWGESISGDLAFLLRPDCTGGGGAAGNPGAPVNVRAPQNPPRVNLSRLVQRSPGQGSQCVSTEGNYAPGDLTVVGLDWNADPAVGEAAAAGLSIFYEVQIENTAPGAMPSCPVAGAPQSLDDPKQCTWLMAGSSNAGTQSTARSLQAGSPYRWRVRSILRDTSTGWPNVASLSEGPWSDWQTFITAPRPHPPTLNTPIDGFKIKGFPQTKDLTWIANTCRPSGYEVELRRVYVSGVRGPAPPRTLASPACGQSGLDLGLGAPVSHLITSYSALIAHDGEYRWRVRTCTTAGTSPWSPERKFTKSSP